MAKVNIVFSQVDANCRSKSGEVLPVPNGVFDTSEDVTSTTSAQDASNQSPSNGSVCAITVSGGDVRVGFYSTASQNPAAAHLILQGQTRYFAVGAGLYVAYRDDA
jgi:hypothetical protein